MIFVGGSHDEYFSTFLFYGVVLFTCANFHNRLHSVVRGPVPRTQDATTRAKFGYAQKGGAVMSRLTVKQIETVEYTLPVHLAPLLFNGDWSGLESDELEAVEKWLVSEGNPCFVDMSEDSWFAHTNDFDDLGNTVATYTAIAGKGVA